jgi:hypothetical protein
MGDDADFAVQPAGKMRATYGLTADNRRLIQLDPREVPSKLRHLVPLAEHFGIPDDLIRQDLLAKTPAEEVEEMRRVVAAHDEAFDEWLGGPEAAGPNYSAEYIAFTCLRMAADEC